MLDLQAAGCQSYGRPVRTLAKLLAHPDLAAANAALTRCVNLDVFLEESRRSQGGMVGSAKLAWPDGKEEQLGLTLLLIAKFGEDPDFMASFGHTYFHSGAEIISSVREVTRQVIIPFVRDYKAYVMSQGRTKPRLVMPLSNKVFVVHGHDEGSREGVARFLAHVGFEPMILHERPNKGRTIITKFREEAADIGFAVVLMTPDDTGGKARGDARPRARQNVVFELGFHRGAWARARRHARQG